MPQNTLNQSQIDALAAAAVRIPARAACDGTLVGQRLAQQFLVGEGMAKDLRQDLEVSTASAATVAQGRLVSSIALTRCLARCG